MYLSLGQLFSTCLGCLVVDGSNSYFSLPLPLMAKRSLKRMYWARFSGKYSSRQYCFRRTAHTDKMRDRKIHQNKGRKICQTFPFPSTQGWLGDSELQCQPACLKMTRNPGTRTSDPRCLCPNGRRSCGTRTRSSRTWTWGRTLWAACSPTRSCSPTGPRSGRAVSTSASPAISSPILSSPSSSRRPSRWSTSFRSVAYCIEVSQFLGNCSGGKSWLSNDDFKFTFYACYYSC